MYKQKIYKLLIGTNNKGKLREIKSLLPKNIKIHSTSEFNLKSPPENGLTFKENSLIKSNYFSKKTGLKCLADDSGLEIDLLDKSPGIYSARWGGRDGDFSKAIKRVYRELNRKDKNWKNKKIKARFICALSISYLNKKIASIALNKNGLIILAKNDKQIISIINEVAPEHLEINVNNYKKYYKKILNAGSICNGKYTPMSASDYTVGTNHVLPTSGSSKFSSGLNTNEFIKKISVITLSKLGVEKIGNPAITLSEFEQLYGHAQSIKSRIRRK